MPEVGIDSKGRQHNLVAVDFADDRRGCPTQRARAMARIPNPLPVTEHVADHRPLIGIQLVVFVHVANHTPNSVLVKTGVLRLLYESNQAFTLGKAMNITLKQKLLAFEIDQGEPQLKFTDRLARENAWSTEFSRRVVQEYLRFLYLACISTNPVTPSIAVDQAWHLHLCYTRSYWIDLCQEVLGRSLHHGPTRGGIIESSKYHCQYAETLLLYEREFGQVPPTDIWPSVDVRFSPSANPFWVSHDRFLVISKERLRKVGFCGGAVASGLLLTGAASSNNGYPVFIIFLILLSVGLIIWVFKRNGGGGTGGGSSCGSSCSSSSDSRSGCGGDSGCSGCGGGCGGD